MRISHSKKFVFLATPRTGSTTTRNILDKYSDIKSVHITETTKQFPFYHHISAAELRSIFESRGWDWDGYKKFCFVRNPFDRVVSLYHYNNKMKKELKVTSSRMLIRKIRHTLMPAKSFEDYVMAINPENRLQTSLTAFLCNSGNDFLVHDVLMFENLRNELPDYLRSIDIEISSNDIPHLNASSSRQEYQAYYNKKTIEVVSDLYRYEIEKFGYSF
jgi:hypothetical protein